ncbi:hypothetical protein L1987_33676 [Smallanthus sonchifolius]|uniref:Uncharacterized protein n=1 Tax=Smallanthus sonchifolius TaxID=185202 RepID=A0ACB9HT49_9ASTR|nr:hypothetical protein L1987_33676 [Smallanthus sonchifolius]
MRLEQRGGGNIRWLARGNKKDLNLFDSIALSFVTTESFCYGATTRNNISALLTKLRLETIEIIVVLVLIVVNLNDSGCFFLDHTKTNQVPHRILDLAEENNELVDFGEPEKKMLNMADVSEKRNASDSTASNKRSGSEAYEVMKDD